MDPNRTRRQTHYDVLWFDSVHGLARWQERQHTAQTTKSGSGAAAESEGGTRERRTAASVAEPGAFDLSNLLGLFGLLVILGGPMALRVRSPRP